MKDYKELGYSTMEIKSHIYKVISLPLYLVVMTLIGSILMYHTGLEIFGLTSQHHYGREMRLRM